MKNLRKFTFILLISISLSCNNESDFGGVNINFNNVVGDEDLVLNDNVYTKNGEESFTVSELKYIISNIRLIDAGGNEFVYPQDDSYFLINEEVSSSLRLNLKNINANNYTSIKFGVGVDQSKYPLEGVENFVPRAQDEDMIWSWSAGFIFMKIEGLFSTPESTDQIYKYHIGSHGQNLDNYREVSLNFLQPLAVKETQTPVVNINFDILKLFTGQHDMLLEDKADIQIDPENAPKIAENYVEAFEIGMN